MSNNKKLTRSISLSQFFSISFGAAVGVGWIMLMGDWLELSGSVGAILAFLVSGLAVGWVALGYLELATAIPKPGGEMIYSFEVFGPRMGFVVGWFLAAGNVAISAFEGISIGWVVSVIAPIPDGPALYRVLGENVYAIRMATGIGFLIFMGWLNYRGAVFAASAQKVFVVLFFTAAAIFIIAGVIKGNPANLAPMFRGETMADAFRGIAGMLAVAPFFILGFNFALQGIAERAPGVTLRGVARIIILSILAIALFYALVVATAAMSAPRDVILNADLPTEAAFRATLGNGVLGKLVLVAGLFGLLTTWNAMLFAAARIVFELSVKGLLPKVFSRVHPKYGSPYIAAIFVTAASLPGVFLSGAALSPIISAASICAIFALFVTCLAMYVRHQKSDAVTPEFTVPGGSTGRISVVAVGGVLLLTSVLQPFISESNLRFPLSWWVVIVWAVLGWLLWMGKKKERARGCTIAPCSK